MDRLSDLSVIDKLLSHRVRGFGAVENSRSAFLAACMAATPYLEIDTRVSRDGTIFVHHDPKMTLASGTRVAVYQTFAETLDSAQSRDAKPAFRLRDALDLFVAHAGPRQRLCIDIKDYGFEAAHLQLVRDARLEDRVVFASWIPQTILRLGEIRESCTLVLSCLSVISLGKIGRACVRLMKDRCFPIGSAVVMGCKAVDAPLDHLAGGYQHALVCARLPRRLRDALHSTGGGICVHRYLIGSSLKRYCRDEGLQLWTYGVTGPRAYLRLARDPEIDVVFCDDAANVQRALAGPSPKR